MGIIFSRASEGAILGNMIGGAIGTLAMAIPGVNVITAPVMVAALTAASGSAAGTLIGGAAGAVSGAIEEKVGDE